MMRGQTQSFCNNLLLFECARAKTCSVTATGQEFCYKSPATSSPLPSGRRICLPWNYSMLFMSGSTESMIEPMLFIR